MLWGAVLLGLLLSVLGGTCARSAAAAVAGPAVHQTGVREAPAVPGCDPVRQGTDDRQGVPTRGTGAHELLAPLAHAHGQSAAAAVLETLAPCAPAGRAPPPADAPSPVELSVLRV
jgi:pyrimidine deaminase RibD-like protein